MGSRSVQQDLALSGPANSGIRSDSFTSLRLRGVASGELQSGPRCPRVRSGRPAGRRQEHGSLAAAPAQSAPGTSAQRTRVSPLNRRNVMRLASPLSTLPQRSSSCLPPSIPRLVPSRSDPSGAAAARTASEGTCRSSRCWRIGSSSRTPTSGPGWAARTCGRTPATGRTASPRRTTTWSSHN